MSRLVRRNVLPTCRRLVVAGYGTQTKYVQEIVGDHAFVHLKARKYTIERCVVVPKNDSMDILQLAAILVGCAVRREGCQAGNAIVFVPGLQEMQRLAAKIKEANKNIIVWMLHSDIVGAEEEEAQDIEHIKKKV